ncbi:hypothetical protein CC78DRAFT_577494 [Lojkania enalia]|uniref:Uncharacterized protein n=1 Tax=Lojkania enalia TaxID=147567 RepID=A0A9P4KE66_9PLEO|nr:hypothetical protein CC78DRAFT_577494 [Didymosphaeria enalia]
MTRWLSSQAPVRRLVDYVCQAVPVPMEGPNSDTTWTATGMFPQLVANLTSRAGPSGYPLRRTHALAIRILHILSGRSARYSLRGHKQGPELSLSPPELSAPTTPALRRTSLHHHIHIHPPFLHTHAVHARCLAPSSVRPPAHPHRYPASSTARKQHSSRSIANPTLPATGRLPTFPPPTQHHTVRRTPPTLRRAHTPGNQAGAARASVSAQRLPQLRTDE